VKALLRWRSPDPPVTVARLRGQLGAVADADTDRAMEANPGPGRADADLDIELDRLTIVVVRAEDRPTGAPGDERLELVRQPSAAGLIGPHRSAGGDVTPPRLVAIGWATVEIARFASDLGRAAIPCPNDVILGAFAALVTGDPSLVLLEPETEGRLVASLAHWGEIPVALYVAAGSRSGGLTGAAARLRRRGFQVTPIAPGPFGPEVAIAGGPVRGPHVLVCEPAGPAIPVELRDRDALR